MDELVHLFSDVPPPPPEKLTKRSPKLQEKIDIHAALFERAWQLDSL